MKDRTVKRIKLALTIISILSTISVLVVILQVFVFDPYIKAKISIIPDIYRDRVNETIIKIDEMDDDYLRKNIRGELWYLCSSVELSKDFTDINTIQSLKELSDYVRVTYIIIAFITMLVSVVFTKWYTSYLDTFIEYTDQKKNKKSI